MKLPIPKKGITAWMYLNELNNFDHIAEVYWTKKSAEKVAMRQVIEKSRLQTHQSYHYPFTL